MNTPQILTIIAGIFALLSFTPYLGLFFGVGALLIAFVALDKFHYHFETKGKKIAYSALILSGILILFWLIVIIGGFEVATYYQPFIPTTSECTLSSGINCQTIQFSNNDAVITFTNTIGRPLLLLAFNETFQFAEYSDCHEIEEISITNTENTDESLSLRESAIQILPNTSYTLTLQCKNRMKPQDIFTTSFQLYAQDTERGDIIHTVQGKLSVQKQ